MFARRLCCGYLTGCIQSLCFLNVADGVEGGGPWGRERGDGQVSQQTRVALHATKAPQKRKGARCSRVLCARSSDIVQTITCGKGGIKISCWTRACSEQKQTYTSNKTSGNKTPGTRQLWQISPHRQQDQKPHATPPRVSKQCVVAVPFRPSRGEQMHTLQHLRRKTNERKKRASGTHPIDRARHGLTAKSNNISSLKLEAQRCGTVWNPSGTAAI